MNTLALCIPAYNAGVYLPRLLQSARNQTIPFDEILVYNDCSTDDTEAVARKYGATVIKGDINRGCSNGKNQLAALTKCDWIHFHDADDDILPNFTTLVHQWMKAKGSEYEVLLLNFKYINAQTGQLLGTANHNVLQLHADALKYTIENKTVNFGVYNRSLFIKVGGFDTDPEVLYNEDNAVHQRLAKAGFRFDFLPEITCINYWHGKSMSSLNRLKCIRANYHVLNKTAIEYDNKYPFEIAQQLWVCATMSASFEDWEYVKKSIILAKKLGYGYPPTGNKLFKSLAFISPFFTIYLREKLIRLFKPWLRND